MSQEIYVVKADMSGDTAYYLFENGDYYDAFVDLADYLLSHSYSSMIYKIETLKEKKNLFPNLTDMKELKKIIEDVNLEDLFPENTIQETWSLREFRELTKDKEVVSEADVMIL